MDAELGEGVGGDRLTLFPWDTHWKFSVYLELNSIEVWSERQTEPFIMTSSLEG